MELVCEFFDNVWRAVLGVISPSEDEVNRKKKWAELFDCIERVGYESIGDPMESIQQDSMADFVIPASDIHPSYTIEIFKEKETKNWKLFVIKGDKDELLDADLEYVLEKKSFSNKEVMQAIHAVMVGDRYSEFSADWDVFVQRYQLEFLY